MQERVARERERLVAWHGYPICGRRLASASPRSPRLCAMPEGHLGDCRPSGGLPDDDEVTAGY